MGMNNCEREETGLKKTFALISNGDVKLFPAILVRSSRVCEVTAIDSHQEDMSPVPA